MRVERAQIIFSIVKTKVICFTVNDGVNFLKQKNIMVYKIIDGLLSIG